jgi:hypothetical protein
MPIQPALNAGWQEELVAAEGPLGELAAAVDQAGPAGRGLTVMPRCAGALATLPVVAAYHREVCVLWFYAHADVHLPDTTTTGYLGGMALSGPLGWWDSGHGAGVKSAVLVGALDADPPEQQLLAERGLPVTAAGDDLASCLGASEPVLPRLTGDPPSRMPALRARALHSGRCTGACSRSSSATTHRLQASDDLDTPCEAKLHTAYGRLHSLC